MPAPIWAGRSSGRSRRFSNGPRSMRLSLRPKKEREAPVKQTVLSVPSPDKANAVLNRIEIPQDTVERISELLTPASSLIISDNGFSHETGKDTDFIVVTH